MHFVRRLENNYDKTANRVFYDATNHRRPCLVSIAEYFIKKVINNSICIEITLLEITLASDIWLCYNVLSVCDGSTRILNIRRHCPFRMEWYSKWYSKLTHPSQTTYGPVAQLDRATAF